MLALVVTCVSTKKLFGKSDLDLFAHESNVSQKSTDVLKVLFHNKLGVGDQV